MKIDFPTPAQGMALARLWQEAFGDTLEFIEGFFCTGYSPARCRCLTVDGQIAAALYWFETSCKNQRYAYIYAVATAKAFRGQGLCRKLMEDTHAHLTLRGYDGCLLVPQTEDLRQMYAKLGYQNCAAFREFTCGAAQSSVRLQRIDREEYALARRELLPEGGVIQEEENIAYQEMMTFFYRGADFLLAARREGKTLISPEILGNPNAAPGILKALDCTKGVFRTPGSEAQGAMFLPLSKKAAAPTYFGLAFL